MTRFSEHSSLDTRSESTPTEGDLSVLLASGDHDLPLELELEVAKMIYRNFEVYPPVEPDPHPELGSILWEIASAYVNPRVLIQGKHSAVASLAIEAIVAMRSSHALEAWRAAADCPRRWFGEIVTDDLGDLQKRWVEQGAAAADWLGRLREQVFCPHPEQEVNSAEHS